MVVTAAATFSALFIPLGLLSVFSLPGRTAIEWGITALYAADLVVRFRRRPPAGRERQRAGRWLAVDLVAALPVYPLLGATPLQLLRLVKLARVAQFIRHWRHLLLRHWNVLRLAFFVYWLTLSVHWFACTWIVLRRTGGPPHSPDHYIDALYWCITTLATVGYGDVLPETNAQKVFAMGVMLLGVGIYSYVIGNVATILANIDPARTGYLRQMEQLAAFMQHRNLPSALQRRIRDYYVYLWERRRGFDESSVLSTLPPSLRTEVALFLKRDLIQNVPLFKDAEDAFLRGIALEMQAVVYLPGDYILKAGEYGRDMYFISQGAVEVLSPDGETRYDTLSEGEFFGEIALVLDQPRTATVRALDYCALYRLDRAMLDRIVAHHPAIAAQIEQQAHDRAGTHVPLL